MFFNSVEFLIFFPVVVGLYFATPHRFRWILLLAASYYFYMAWEPAYALLIAGSTVVDYFTARAMGSRATKRERRPFLWLSLAANLGLLGYFKYANFFAGSLNALRVLPEVPYHDFLLPVGISFYTFQTLSYTIDVYRGARDAERHFGIFALYVSFFPQLVAGPIERSTRLLPQFFEHYGFDYERVASGLRLMLWGFFKKVVIADHVATYVDVVYNSPADHTGLTVWIATYFFAFQIYCDFSGYSDIAIGTARVMGYELMDNFRRPYFSKSIAEFWRRWHISLSTWFRDYVYIPLGGNRVSKGRWYANLMIVFLVSGLWHGANWTFVVWGGLHGLYLVVGLVTQPARDQAWSRVVSNQQLQRMSFLPSGATVRKWVAVFVTFHLVVLAGVFFRAANVGEAWLLLGNMFQAGPMLPALPVFGNFELLLAFAGIGFMELVHLSERTETIV
ncbi:MAG: MBOAT family protein, partial [Bacteroidota bacterium]